MGQTLYRINIDRTYCIIWLGNATYFIVKVPNIIDEIHILRIVINIIPTLLRFVDVFFNLFICGKLRGKSILSNIPDYFFMRYICNHKDRTIDNINF